MALNGIDVSQWQGKIDWQKVKEANVQFAMIRAGYGQNNVDHEFHRNAREANKVGIPIGLYWFSYALNYEMARKEAIYATILAKEYEISWPIAYDLEYDSIDYARKNGITITKTMATEMARSFCEEVKKQNYIPMVYANLDYLKNYLDLDRLPYPLWYAQYSSTPSIKKKEIWQYTSMGKVPGIKGSVDLDYGYQDYKDQIHLPTLPDLSDAPILELVVDVIEGKYGIGEERKLALGNRYHEVQEFLNHIHRASVQELAREVIDGRYGNGVVRKIVLGNKYEKVQDKVNDSLQYYYYTIQPGDTLSEIAQRFGTTVKRLQSLNGIGNPHRIYSGITIRIK